MFIKDLKNCQEIIAGDKTILREILHPENNLPNPQFALPQSV